MPARAPHRDTELCKRGGGIAKIGLPVQVAPRAAADPLAEVEVREHVTLRVRQHVPQLEPDGPERVGERDVARPLALGVRGAGAPQARLEARRRLHLDVAQRVPYGPDLDGRPAAKAHEQPLPARRRHDDVIPADLPARVRRSGLARGRSDITGASGYSSRRASGRRRAQAGPQTRERIVGRWSDSKACWAAVAVGE